MGGLCWFLTDLHVWGGGVGDCKKDMQSRGCNENKTKQKKPHRVGKLRLGYRKSE